MCHEYSAEQYTYTKCPKSIEVTQKYKEWKLSNINNPA